MHVKTMVELDFWQTLSIVISPIVVGAISTHFLSRSWQKYQQKISLKQELIILYNESVVSLRTIQRVLVIDMVESVSGTLMTDDELAKQAKVKSTLVFPENPTEELEKKFHSRYLELTQMAGDAANKRNLLKIRLKLYTDDTTISDELSVLIQYNLKHRVLIKNILKSKNASDFKTLIREITKNSDEYNVKSNDFATKLVNMKIKNIIV